MLPNNYQSNDNDQDQSPSFSPGQTISPTASSEQTVSSPPPSSSAGSDDKRLFNSSTQLNEPNNLIGQPKQVNVNNIQEEIKINQPVQEQSVNQDKAEVSIDQGLDSDPENLALPISSDVEPIVWTASEFIAHEKPASWFLILASVAIVIALAAWLITKDLLTVTVIIVSAFTFGFYARQKPRTLQYRLDELGLTIANKFYSYTDFHSFYIQEEGAFYSISFFPLKRFGTLITVYFDPTIESQIQQILVPRLPIETKKNDIVDSFMKRIRF